MKFKFALGSLLILMSMSSIVNAQIDANKAISELSILQESLNQSDINERMLKETREKAIDIRTEALSCVNRIEPQVETLKLEVEALEQISPDVDIQIYERLSESRGQLSAEDAKLKNCSLTVQESLICQISYSMNSRPNYLAKRMKIFLMPLQHCLLN